MTMRTYTHLLCDCGHRGTIRLSENDQPYSEPWQNEEYLDGDHRARYTGTDSTFAKEGQTCPGCGIGSSA